jgi:hypothetical protein
MVGSTDRNGHGGLADCAFADWLGIPDMSNVCPHTLASFHPRSGLPGVIEDRAGL